MKRWMAALLAVICMYGGAAQAKKKEPEPVLIPNPLHASTPEEIRNKVGAWMQPPEQAALVSWLLIDGEQPMGEMLFVLEGVEYSYRAQAAAEMSDISGMNYQFEPREKVQIGGHDGMMQDNIGETQSVGVVLWYDDEASITYSLAMMSDAVADTLLRLAGVLYER